MSVLASNSTFTASKLACIEQPHAQPCTAVQSTLMRACQALTPWLAVQAAASQGRKQRKPSPTASTAQPDSRKRSLRSADEPAQAGSQPSTAKRAKRGPPNNRQAPAVQVHLASTGPTWLAGMLLLSQARLSTSS